MLFTAIICQLVIASVASPYRKYPFVFLLDVGNEELEKTNTEQIRVSIPGGSLAVRYPAVADGDLITHVRVSSIDFGADLKASILEGGPGYKYVVLVFLGNAGVKCDAVITLQTLPNDLVSSSDSSSVSSWKGVNLVSQSSDESEMNNSAEDTSDDSKENIRNDKSDAELALSSSNINDYAVKSNYDDDNDSDEIDERVKLNENVESKEKGNNHYQEFGSIEGDKSDENDEEIQEQDSASNEVRVESGEDVEGDNYYAERLQSDEGYKSYYNSNSFDKKSINEDQSLDEDARMYRQDSIYDAQGHNPSGEDPVELDQMFNDEEIHNDSDKHKDNNNNNFDSEYASAVA